MPTRQELSAAVPDHPVYIQVGYSTRGVVNDAGRRVLEAAGIPTSEAGDVKPDGDGLTFVLRSTNEERMKRRFPDYMKYAVSLGLTTVVDHACCDWLGAHLTAADRPNMAIADYFWRAGKLAVAPAHSIRPPRHARSEQHSLGRPRASRTRRKGSATTCTRSCASASKSSRAARRTGGARRLPTHRRCGLGAVAAHDSGRRDRTLPQDHGAGGREDSGELAALDARARVRDHAGADRAAEEDRRRRPRAGSRLHPQPVLRLESGPAVSRRCSRAASRWARARMAASSAR